MFTRIEHFFGDLQDLAEGFPVIAPSTSTVIGYNELVSLPYKRKSHETSQGYPVSRFGSHVPAEFLCVHCKNVVKKPLECKKCSKLCCHNCVNAIQKETDSKAHHFFCSFCQSQQELKRPSLILIRIIAELKIKCNNFEIGCQNLINLDDVNRHDLVCPYREIYCANFGTCKKIGLIKDFIEKEFTHRSIYTVLGERSHVGNKFYFCSEPCKKLVEFEKIVNEKQNSKAINEYYEILLKIQKKEIN